MHDEKLRRCSTNHLNSGGPLGIKTVAQERGSEVEDVFSTLDPPEYARVLKRFATTVTAGLDGDRADEESFGAEDGRQAASLHHAAKV